MANLPLNINGILYYFKDEVEFASVMLAAVAAYRRRYKAEPNTCYLNSKTEWLDMLPGITPLEEGEQPNNPIRMKVADNISPNYLWVTKETK